MEVLCRRWLAEMEWGEDISVQCAWSFWVPRTIPFAEMKFAEGNHATFRIQASERRASCERGENLPIAICLKGRPADPASPETDDFNFAYSVQQRRLIKRLWRVRIFRRINSFRSKFFTSPLLVFNSIRIALRVEVYTKLRNCIWYPE